MFAGVGVGAGKGGGGAAKSNKIHTRGWQLSYLCKERGDWAQARKKKIVTRVDARGSEWAARTRHKS